MTRVSERKVTRPMKVLVTEDTRWTLRQLLRREILLLVEDSHGALMKRLRYYDGHYVIGY